MSKWNFLFYHVAFALRGEPSRRIVHSLATTPEVVADDDGALNQVSCSHAFIFGGQRGGSI